MELSFRVTRALHDDHMAVTALLQTVSTALRGAVPETVPGTAPEAAPAPVDSRLAGILVQLAGAVEGEIAGHFALEEDGLFPLLAAAGEGDLGRLLTEEHAIILPLGRRVAALAREGARRGFEPAGWSEFRRLGLEFAGLLVGHVEKEEMGLLPVIEEILTSDDDQRLADAYAAGLPPGTDATSDAAPDATPAAAEPPLTEEAPR